MQMDFSSKMLVILTLMLVVGVLFLSGNALAYSDFTPPEDDSLLIENVRLSGDMLSFTVTDIDTGLIQEIVLDITEYVDLFQEYVTIEVQNHDRSKSKTFQIRNPYYIPGMEPPEENIEPEPPEPTNPFTPDGNGTVVDNANGSEGKEFFTVETPDGNIFYLIIDRHRTAENVYLLNAVTERDLMSLVDSDDITEEDTPIGPLPPIEPEIPDEVDVVEPPEEKSRDNSTVIFIVIAVIIAGGAGYYFKVVRPKQNADVYDDEDEEEEEISDDEEIDIEDDED